MAAYVLNLAKDGSHYWVFATVTPLGDGFLSVRMAPRSPLFDAAKELYQAGLRGEREAAERGRLNRAETAQVGADLLQDLLRPLGFTTYDEFILEALPAEVAARGRLVSSSYSRSWVRGPVADLLNASLALEGRLAELVGRLDGYRQLCDALRSAAGQVTDMAHRLDHAVGIAQEASAEVAREAPVLLNVAKVMATPMGKAVTALDELAPRLELLQGDISSLRFRIALANLHNDMVAAFAAEVADGLAPATSLGEVPLLCDAVQEGVAEMAQMTRIVNAELRAVAELVGQAGERIDDFRRFLGQWRILVLRHRQASTLNSLIGPIDDEIAVGHQNIELLRDLGQYCRSSIASLDVDALDAELSRIRLAARSA
jgi:aerotaxis receptor